MGKFEILTIFRESAPFFQYKVSMKTVKRHCWCQVYTWRGHFGAGYSWAAHESNSSAKKKAASQGILDDLVTNKDGRVGGPIIHKLDKILDELKDIKEKSKWNDDEIKRLNTVVDNQSKIIEGQQRFLKSLDAD